MEDEAASPPSARSWLPGDLARTTFCYGADLRYASVMAFTSFRTRLRAFQAMRCDPPDAGFIADLEFLENRDLDLSVRLGGMLAFNALLVTIGTHPISASPGAPLSLDAPTQPVMVIASIIGFVPFIISSALCLRALLLGEEFDSDGLEGDAALRQRLLRPLCGPSMLRACCCGERCCCALAAGC